MEITADFDQNKKKHQTSEIQIKADKMTFEIFEVKNVRN